MKLAKRKVMIWMLALVLAGFIGIRWTIPRARPSHSLGVSNGRLAECPDRPNCVSTQAKNADQRMSPIVLDMPKHEAIAGLESVIREMPRSRLVTSSEDYLHAEFHSLILGFVDDVEFQIDESNELIHFRSASRLGYADLGVNRKRMEEITRRFADQ